MTAHSKLGASSMYRWAACPGSVREAAKAPPSQESSYAAEGSNAHALAALCLRKTHNPGAYIGKTLTEDGRKFTVDKDMALAVQVYIDAVDEVADNARSKAIMLVEERFDLSDVHPGCFGTADCVLIDDSAQTLHVFDYKHGAGIPVEVRGNPQLRYYALGALRASGYPARRIRMTIVQPRCDHPDGPVRSDEIDALDLIDWQADLKAYAQATEAADAPLAPGDHCRFCPAARSCPALEARSQAIAKTEFSPAVSYDPAKLSEALTTLDVLEARITAIREFAYAEAEAGRAIPGWKLVAKRARRKWRDEGEIAKHLQTSYRDVVLRDAYEPPTLKSPAQLEKVDGIGKGALDKFVIQESSGHVLVPESDKRPAVAGRPKDEFTAIPVKTIFD